MSDLEGFLEGVSVAPDQPLQQDRHRAAPPRFGRRPPLAPRRDAVVVEHPLKGDGQEGLQAAAPLEFPQDRVVVVHQPQPRVRREVLRIGGVEMVPAAHEGDDAIDQREMREKERLAGHGRAVPGGIGRLPYAGVLGYTMSAS